MAQTLHTQSVKIGHGNYQSGNITGSFNTTLYKSDGDAQIMRWLSLLEPSNRHHGVRNDRFAGVGDWLLQTREFQEWRGGEGGADKAVLFCSGGPGVGKTYMSSLVIDSLCDQARNEDITVACLYCDFLAQQEQTLTGMMGAILKQLVGKGGIPIYLREAFQQGKQEIGGRALLFADLIRMLKMTIASLPQVFICIDALDEFLPKDVPVLLESLRDIVRESLNTKIFLTGRPHVKEDIQRYFPRVVLIPINPKTGDIRNYLEMRLDRDAEPEAMSDGLRADIIRIMIERTSNIFLLVALNIDAVLGEVTIRQRRKKLEEMVEGNGLSDAYTATLTRVKGQKGNKSVLGVKVLMWVSYSERPLRAQELCHALGVEIGSSDLELENIPALRTLTASCLGLVTIEASSSTVRLVHFTLQEHLLSNPALFHNPHSTIAEICLTYLNYGSVCDFSPTLTIAPLLMPLLEYASCYWGEHARMGMTENAKTLALRLLDTFDGHISAQLLLLRYKNGKTSGPSFSQAEGPVGFTGLHGVSFLGIVEIIACVLDMKKWDLNQRDCMGCTALTWAAIRGHEGVVKILLEREDISPDQVDTESGRTPLLWAATNGHEGVVRILLEREDVNPNQADIDGRTPVWWAVERGNAGAVKILLEREDVNPNRVDTKFGCTPLLWAIKEGHEGIVKILLERDDVNPNEADIDGRAPLWRAAEHGHAGIVEKILEREDVNPNPVHTGGRTPLLRAAMMGHEGAVRIFLEREDMNPNQADTDGRTPLWWAAERGHAGVVKILLEREDVNPNQADTDGRTPLSLPARNGYKGVVRILLEREDVNPNQVDTDGRGPLSLAAKNGHEGVVWILLGREDVNPNQVDTGYAQTPLSLAAENGHEWVVRILLEREDANPNQVDTKFGRTPLLWAIKEGHEGVVKVLLERKDVNPNQADSCGQTPLLWAADKWHGVVKALLERGDVNPNQADTKFGWTPLLWAAMMGHERVVKILLEREDVNPNQVDTGGRTPLLWAAMKGHEGVVGILLQREDVNPNQAGTKYGRTPLLWATKEGHERVVKILLEREDVNPNQADPHGLTPLWWAVLSRREATVKMLLERDGINPNQADTEYGRTPLSWAAGHGHVAVVKILLERQDVSTTALDHEGQTPLSLALSRGYNDVARILRDNSNSCTTHLGV